MIPGMAAATVQNVVGSLGRGAKVVCSATHPVPLVDGYLCVLRRLALARSRAHESADEAGLAEYLDQMVDATDAERGYRRAGVWCRP